MYKIIKIFENIINLMYNNGKYYKGDIMINKPTIIAKFFNLPERTARNWAKEEAGYYQAGDEEKEKNFWRFKLLEKLDAYMMLEQKAYKKILSLFTEEELNTLAECIFRSDYFPLLEVQAGYDLKELLKQIILYECEDEKTPKALLLKSQELCEFEIYSLFDLLEKADNKAQELAEDRAETEEGKEYAQADFEEVLKIFRELF